MGSSLPEADISTGEASLSPEGTQTPQWPGGGQEPGQREARRVNPGQQIFPPIPLKRSSAPNKSASPASPPALANPPPPPPKKPLRVEVKGTTSAGDSVELTAAEVRFAARGNPPVHLAVVSSIEINNALSPPRASGGELYIYEDFNPSEHTLAPVKYRCTLDHSRGKYA